MFAEMPKAVDEKSSEKSKGETTEKGKAEKERKKKHTEICICDVKSKKLALRKV